MTSPSIVDDLETNSPHLVRSLQEMAARAAPAARIDNVEGWEMRHAPGCAWWLGTTLAHGGTEPDTIARRVTAAEAFYARLGEPARFQISPPASSEAIDTLLAERGYHRHSPVSLRISATAHVAEYAQGTGRPHLTPRPTRAWFDARRAISSSADRDPHAEWDMLNRVEQPSAYATLAIEEDIVAVGRGVLDTGWVGVFDMATLPAARGKGAAGAVLAALADWSGAQGANHMYLQVESGNAPALRLYERAGFTEISGFHYRTAR